jgi:hypothetical protein
MFAIVRVLASWRRGDGILLKGPWVVDAEHGLQGNGLYGGFRFQPLEGQT